MIDCQKTMVLTQESLLHVRAILGRIFSFKLFTNVDLSSFTQLVHISFTKHNFTSTVRSWETHLRLKNSDC